MVSRFREELAHGRDVEEAVAITVATAGRAVTFSGLTVSICLFGLVFFSINMLRSVGMGGVLVVLMAVFAAITLLPAVLVIIGTRVNAFPVRIPKRWRRKRSPAIPDGSTNTDPQYGFWYRLSQLVMRYPVRIFVPVLLVLITLGLPFLEVRFSAPDASILPADVPSRAAYDLLASRFNSRETTPILLAVRTQSDLPTSSSIHNLYCYVRRLEAHPPVSPGDSISSTCPPFSPLPLYFFHSPPL